MGIRGSNKTLGLGNSKKPSPPNNFNWRAAESVYGDWRSRRAPKMRRAGAEERAAFAAEIRAKTTLFGGGQ